MERSKEIRLMPWICAVKDASIQTNSKFSFEPQAESDTAILISIISVKPESLPLLGCFQLHNDTKKEVIAYLSSSFQVNSISYQIAYVPYKQSRSDVQTSNSIADILKSFSSLIVTDVVGNGLHRFKEDRSLVGDPHRMVIVNGKEVCLFQIKDGVFDITKKGDLWIDQQTLTGPSIQDREAISMQSVGKIIEEYLQEYYLFLNSDKNWKVLADTVLARYKIEKYMKSEHSSWKKRLVFQGLPLLQEKLISKLNQENLVRNEQERQMVSALLKKLHVNSTIHTLDVLLQLKEQYSSKQVSSFQQLQHHQQYLTSLFQKSHIHPSFSAFITSQLQTDLLLTQRDTLLQRQSLMQQLIIQRNQQLSLKNRKIEQFKQMIEQFTQKADQMRKNTMRFIEVGKLYEQEKQKNWKLKLELDSHAFLIKKGSQCKAQLQSKIHLLMKEKGDLLSGLQELTEQNLSLLNQRETLQQQITDLKDKLQQSHTVQARALRSIQNQAQIKVRLSRYQNYVKELKQIFSSFKRLQIEKFNFILEHNYKEHQQLEERYRCSQYELRRAQGRLKEMQENLHCERIKNSYFEKMIRGSDHHDTIPEVSEENSETDRQVPAHS